MEEITFGETSPARYEFKEDIQVILNADAVVMIANLLLFLGVDT
jgi:hypothetical protein